MTRKKLLQIELNEFDPVFLRNQAEILGLSNIIRFLEFEHTVTNTNDKIEHQGLDPWVQWVNIHVGMPSIQHGIKRLGDTSRQTNPQIWETLAKSGNRWGAWGVMNAPMGAVEGCEFFMPDPWSFEEDAYPNNLNDLLALPRYMARNYLESDKTEIIKQFLRFAKYYAPPSHWPILLKFTSEFVKASFSVGISLHSLTTLLDYLGTLEFIRSKKRKSPEFSVIFLNHIAHLQHQFWIEGQELHPEMKFGLQINNLIMGLLLDSCDKDEAIIILNGLKQENVAGKGFYVYRQKNPETVFKKLLPFADFQVEQCMTNDAHIRFKDGNDAKNAFSRLRNMKLASGHDLFFVEQLGPNHIFTQLSLEHEVDVQEKIICENNTYVFYDLFEAVCERTGAHIPHGDAYFKNIPLPSTIENYQIYHEVVDYFQTSVAA